MKLQPNLRLGPFSSGAALSLDFMSGNLDPRIDFTRASTATFVGSNGLIQSAAIDAPRFDYDPVTLAAKGLLIEEARTNLLLRSEEFDNAAWAKTDTTVSADSVVAPSGAITADLLTEGTAGTAQVGQTATVSSGATSTFTVYLKRGNTDFVRVQVLNGPNGFRAWYNLNTGAVGTSGVVGAGTLAGASIVNAGNGWYRCVLTGAIPAATAYSVFVNTSTADNSSVRVSNGAYYSWGAQAEAGSFATSYIPTVAATVTRSADVATMTGSNFSSWYNQTQGMFVARAISPGSGTRTAIAADDNTTNNAIRLYTSVLDPKFIVVNGGAIQADIDAGSITANTQFKLGGAYAANDFAASVAGGAAVVDTTGTVPTVDRLRIGTDQAGNYLNGTIAAITYYNMRLPNAQLQALTA